MKPKDFKRWRKSLGLSQKAAAETLGLKRRVVQYYEKGERDGKEVEVPKSVRLACFALSEGVSDYHGPREAPERTEPNLRLVAGLNGMETNGEEGLNPPESEIRANGAGKKPGKHAKDKREKDKDKDRERKKEKNREKAHPKAAKADGSKNGKAAAPDEH